MRQCHDSEEHPNTVPVILALDVTGSMGRAAVKAATCLNSIMTGIFCSDEIKDVEFCVMSIGDIHYDRAPIQISQFESDIRIAEQMDEVFFEGGGGGKSKSPTWFEKTSAVILGNVKGALSIASTAIQAMQAINAASKPVSKGGGGK